MPDLTSLFRAALSGKPLKEALALAYLAGYERAIADLQAAAKPTPTETAVSFRGAP